MTRTERQSAFSDALEEFLKKNVGPLTVAEVVGIMQCHMTTMILNSEFEPVDDDDDGENWKKA